MGAGWQRGCPAASLVKPAECCPQEPMGAVTLNTGGGDHTGKAACVTTFRGLSGVFRVRGRELWTCGTTDHLRRDARPDTAVGTGQRGHHLAKPERVHSHRRVLALKGPGSARTEGTVAPLCPSRPHAVGFSKLSGWVVSSEAFSGPPPAAQGPHVECAVSFPTTHTAGRCRRVLGAPGPSRHRPGAHPRLPWLPWLYVAPLGLSRPLRAPVRWVCSSLGFLLGDPAWGLEDTPASPESQACPCPRALVTSRSLAQGLPQQLSLGRDVCPPMGPGRSPAGLCHFTLVPGPLLLSQKARQAWGVSVGAIHTDALSLVAVWDPPPGPRALVSPQNTQLCGVRLLDHGILRSAARAVLS